MDRLRGNRGNAPAVPVNPDACFRAFFALRQDGNQTKVLYSYPMKQHLIMSKYPGLDRFCFPTLTNGTPIVGGGDCSFVFVLTDDGGQRQYGHCANTVNNEAYVIISKLPWVTFFRNVLYSYRANGADIGQLMIRELYSAITPPPGEQFAVRPGGTPLRRPLDLPHAQFVDTNPAMLLDIFSDSQICQVVSSLLLDQNVIVMGPDFGTVSRIILAFLGLLCPMEWQHIIVSIVTPNLVEVLSSPTPFLVGIVKEQQEAVSKVMIESVVFIEVDYVEGVPHGGGYASSSSSAAVSRVLWGREDTRDVTCTDLVYLNEVKVPLPRSGSVFNSTLKKSLRALRATSKGVHNTPNDSSRISEEICLIFMQYYAKRFGMMGSTGFSFEGFLADMVAGVDPVAVPGKPRKAKIFPQEEIEFYERFSQSQGSNGLRLFLRDRIEDGTWSDSDFCMLAMQLNPTFYEEQLASCKAAGSHALKAPSKIMTGALSILFGEGGPLGRKASSDGRRRKGGGVFDWCLRGGGDGGAVDDDEMDDLRRIGERRASKDNLRGGSDAGSAGGLSRKESTVQPVAGPPVASAPTPHEKPVEIHPSEQHPTTEAPPPLPAQSTIQSPAFQPLDVKQVGGGAASYSNPVTPELQPQQNNNNGDVTPSGITPSSSQNGNLEIVETRATTTAPATAAGQQPADDPTSQPVTVANRVLATPPEIGNSKLARTPQSPSVDFSYSNETVKSTSSATAANNGSHHRRVEPPIVRSINAANGDAPTTRAGTAEDDTCRDYTSPSSSSRREYQGPVELST